MAVILFNCALLPKLSRPAQLCVWREIAFLHKDASKWDQLWSWALGTPVLQYVLERDQEKTNIF